MHPFLYFKKSSYLKQIDNDEKTIEEVAEIYSTSPENVEEAVKEYKARKNPFRVGDVQIKLRIFEIGISIFSAMLVLFTLFEMQEERNAAYMPSISFNCEDLKFAWDENNNLINDISNQKESLLAVWDTFGDSYKSGYSVNLSVQNTGVGVAKEVYVNWLYEDNISAFQSIFLNEEKISLTMKDSFIYFELENGLVIGQPYSKQGRYHYGFLSPDLDKTESLSMPSIYAQLYQLTGAYGFYNTLPNIKFSVEYKDVQGEKYQQNFTIKPSIRYAFIKKDNSGVCFLDLDVSEKKKEHFSIQGKLGYLVLGACSVILLECILSVIWGRLQTDKRKETKAFKEKREDDKKSDSGNTDKSQPKS